MRERIIVEIDGGQHSEEANIKKDAARTHWLEREGYKVVRYWNNDVMNNIDGVIIDLMQAMALDEHPTPAHFVRRPSPSRGG